MKALPVDLKTRICKYCNEEKDVVHFPKYAMKNGTQKPRNFCKKCKYLRRKEQLNATPDIQLKTKNYFEKYYQNNRDMWKWKSYKSEDRRKKRNCLSLNEFRELIRKNPYCFYCRDEVLINLGLDRKDNKKGHTLENSVVCCEKCNNILGDIPYEAKILLAPGLNLIKEKQLLNNWVIPTKRKRLNA